MPPTGPDVLGILRELEAFHGCAKYVRRLEPLDELICCILSQHSTDSVSFPTFHALRRTWARWEAIAELTPGQLADAIRPAGLANQKARAILGCLALIHEAFGDYTLDPLARLSDENAREFLLRLPGVGPKTAAIVLCFALGRDVIPVDTHVFRVGWRLGWFDRRIGESKAHDALGRICPEGYAYRLHVALISHGRSICRSRGPRCSDCSIAHRCPFPAGGEGI